MFVARSVTKKNVALLSNIEAASELRYRELRGDGEREVVSEGARPARQRHEGAPLGRGPLTTP